MKNLPDNWELKKLGETIKTIEGDRGANYPKINDFSENGFCLFLSTKNLNEYGFVFENNSFISEEKDKTLRGGKLQLNDVVITTRGTLGNVAVYDEKIKYKNIRVNSSMLILKPIQSILNSNYLARFISSVFFKKQLLNFQSGTAQPQIPANVLKELSIPLPPLEEQIKIASILERADKLRQKRKETNKLFDKILQSVFLDMFGDPVTNPNNFKTGELGNFVNKITDGTHKTPIYTDNGVVFISARNVSSGYINWNDTKYITSQEHNELVKRCNPELGDILLSKSGSIGVAAIVNKNIEFSLFESLALIKFKRDIFNSNFLHHYLNSNSVKQFYLNSIKGISIRHLHLVDIRKLPVILPPIERQNEFARIVEKIESLKEKAKKQEQDLEIFFNSLMQYAFNGRLDLSGVNSTPSPFSSFREGEKEKVLG